MIVPIVSALRPSVCRRNGDSQATTGIEPVDRTDRVVASKVLQTQHIHRGRVAVSPSAPSLPGVAPSAPGSPLVSERDHSLGHVYACWERDRRIPSPGDKALCGLVRVDGPPDAGRPFSTGHACVVCVELYQRGG